MKTILSEKGQLVIPKKIRKTIKVEKGAEFEVEVIKGSIVLRPIKRFKAHKWQDYIGLGDGIVEAHLKDKKKEREEEDVYP